jgi:hypothetical protein
MPLLAFFPQQKYFTKIYIVLFVFFFKIKSLSDVSMVGSSIEIKIKFDLILKSKNGSYYRILH